jgi:hypothetical protein
VPVGVAFAADFLMAVYMLKQSLWKRRRSAVNKRIKEEDTCFY